jgi:hypothetical protein
VVELIYFFSFCEAIVDILLDVERVHKAELGRRTGIKQFLLEGIGVLSVVDDSLAIACTHQPFIVRLKVTHFKSVDCAVHTH